MTLANPFAEQKVVWDENGTRYLFGGVDMERLYTVYSLAKGVGNYPLGRR